MFRKVLVANRGEIALRILRACRELRIQTVTIHSEADKNALHVRFSDESVCVGATPADKSYLNQHAILTAADLSGVDAIHPGYGFLAENADFAKKCEVHGIHFIGPSSEHIRLMGDKIAAKQFVARSGVPLVPGSDGCVETHQAARQLIEERNIRYPVLLKASAGGGGKGMKIVPHPAELERGFNLASGEALAAFGNGAVYVERFILNPRHVEVQVLGDESGKVIHLGERECSLQRRHQKILEEAGAPYLRPDVTRAMHEAATKLARDVGYRSAGTVEFLVDDNQDFFFIEMNTRIQVEHPITEFRTGIDLVKEQIRIAAGQSLRWKQEDVHFRGHAIECRINAEDPVTFTPSPGTITGYHEPGGLGVRVDSAVHDRCTVLPFYDSMLAKLVVFGENRAEAVERMRSSLSEYVVEGIRTNIPLHLRILNDPDFVEGRIDTGYVERLLDGGR